MATKPTNLGLKLFLILAAVLTTGCIGSQMVVLQVVKDETTQLDLVSSARETAMIDDVWRRISTRTHLYLPDEPAQGVAPALLTPPHDSPVVLAGPVQIKLELPLHKASETIELPQLILNPHTDRNGDPAWQMDKQSVELLREEIRKRHP